MVPMSAITVAALACLLPGLVRAERPTLQQLVDSVKLEPSHIDDAFNYLDANHDGQIKKDELNKFFYHKEGKFAVEKFIDAIDNRDPDSDVNKNELADFMNYKPVTLAVHECVFVKSKSLRQWCFADQILVYIYLLLDVDTITGFYNAIEFSDDGDTIINRKEAVALKKWDPKFQGEHVDNFLREIGGKDGKITKAEFIFYVSQEDVMDDFRECWNLDENDKQSGKFPCMIRRLLHATMDHYTELDTAEVFNRLDHDGNTWIEAEDIRKAVPHCQDHWPDRFIQLMDLTGDGKISYAEFRVYTRSHYVKTELEKVCSVLNTQAEELKCYPEKLVELVADNHSPIWLQVPDVDMFFTFEQLDKDNDGLIKHADLVGLGFSADLATKVINEMDGPDVGQEINMEEFNEYVDEPNMVYGMADCLATGVNKRTDCYVAELQDIIQDMLSIESVDKLFKYYDPGSSGKITKKELGKKMKGEPLDNFLAEMGMGDATITRREFTWYVRQQDLSDELKESKDLASLHQAIVTYQQTRLTQFDTQQLFYELDVGHDMELSVDDFKGVALPKVKAVLTKIDRPEDADNTANFLEFWLFFYAPDGKDRKQRMEEACTKKFKKQKDEIACYKTALFTICEATS